MKLGRLGLCSTKQLPDCLNSCSQLCRAFQHDALCVVLVLRSLEYYLAQIFLVVLSIMQLQWAYLQQTEALQRLGKETIP